MSISTHLLDAATGRPAGGVRVSLEDASGDVLANRETDVDGRVADLAGDTPAGVYRLRVDTDAHFGGATFYPEVVVVFRVVDAAAHHHVPVLLSAYAYSTYRGS